MSDNYSAEMIFQPKSYPVYTYVDRSLGNSTYEKRMKRAIRTPGNLVVVSGASKSGKTVLCHRVVADREIVDLSGSQIREADDFWEQIAEKLEVPTEIQITESQGESARTSTKGEGKVSLGISGSLSRQAEKAHTTGNSIAQKSVRNNTQMMRSLIQEGKVLVIDDFHYIEPEVQQYIARTLKTELFHGLKAVILTLPHRSDDAIRLNPDLIGRTTVIDIAPWSLDELKKIAEKGFVLLSFPITPDAIETLARESIASPQLMQENCLSLAEEAREENISGVTAELLQRAFSMTAMNYEYYRQPLQTALKGPAQGRKQRKKYALKTGQHVDGYKLLLLSISKDPPELSFSVEDIKQRILDLLADSPGAALSTLYISNIVNHIEKSFQKPLPQLDTIEWKDKTLYILDPFLLFYLRWDTAWKG